MKKLYYLFTVMLAVASSLTSCVSMDEDKFPDGKEISNYDCGVVVYDVVCPENALDVADLQITYVATDTTGFYLDPDGLNITSHNKTITISKRGENYITSDGDTISNILRSNHIETVYLNNNNSDYSAKSMLPYFGYTTMVVNRYGTYNYNLTAKYVAKTGESASTADSLTVGRICGVIHRRAFSKDLTQLDYPALVLYSTTKVKKEDAASYVLSTATYDWIKSYATFPSAKYAQQYGYILSHVKSFQDCYGVGYDTDSFVSESLSGK